MFKASMVANNFKNNQRSLQNKNLQLLLYCSQLAEKKVWLVRMEDKLSGQFVVLESNMIKKD